MFNAVSNKIKLKLKETEIKNLCANDKKFLPKLLKDTSTALLQVGVDLTGEPTLAAIGPLLYRHYKYNYQISYCYRTGVSVCIYVGRKSVNFAEEVIADGYEFDEIKLDDNPQQDPDILLNAATLWMKFPKYEFRDGLMLIPSEVEKLRASDRQNEKDKKEKEAERTGLKLIQSDAFKTAFTNFILEQNLGVDKGIKLKGLGIKLRLNRKFVKFQGDDIFLWGSPEIDWEYLPNLEKANSSCLFDDFLNAETIENNNLCIQRVYVLYVDESKIHLTSYHNFKFKLNDTRKGVEPIEGTFGPITVRENESTTINLNESKKATVKKFVELYANRGS